jgi:hypothetical protein
MSVNLSLPKEVAEFICGPNRRGYVDDVCRQKVTTQYGEQAAGLYGEQWATFAEYMRVVLGQFQSEAKTREIERNMKAAENKIFASCTGVQQEEDWVVNITGENWSTEAQCIAEKYRKIDIDKILGTFDIAGISRSFTETLSHIRDLALNSGK